MKESVWKADGTVPAGPSDFEARIGFVKIRSIKIRSRMIGAGKIGARKFESAWRSPEGSIMSTAVLEPAALIPAHRHSR